MSMFIWTNIKSQEDLNEELQKHKERYERYLGWLNDLREFFPTVDGKIYNVKIRRAIDELPGIHCVKPSEGCTLFWVYPTDAPGAYYDKSFVSFDGRELLDDETGKRICNEKAQEKITKKIAEYRQRIAKIESDMVDGYQRFQELLKIKEYYTTKYKEFCSETDNLLRKDCTIKEHEL